VVHETLERWKVHCKGHHRELIMAFMSVNSSFGDNDLLHMNLVIVGMEIRFGKESIPFAYPKDHQGLEWGIYH